MGLPHNHLSCSATKSLLQPALNINEDNINAMHTSIHLRDDALLHYTDIHHNYDIRLNNGQEGPVIWGWENRAGTVQAVNLIILGEIYFCKDFKYAQLNVHKNMTLCQSLIGIWFNKKYILESQNIFPRI